MTFNIDIGDGADALAQNQLTDALDGTYWISGWDVTLGTGDLEVDIAAGSGAINGGDVSSGSTQTVDFTGDPDPDDPRKAVISIDDTGTVQKTLGNATPADPSDEIRFRTFDPAPPASVPGVAVAEVWLATGVTSLETVDIRDRRVANEATFGGEFTNKDGAESFTESGVTVIETDTEIANRSIQLSTVLEDDTFLQNPIPFSDRVEAGVIFEPSKSFSELEYEISDKVEQDSGDRVILEKHTDNTQIDTISSADPGDTGTFNENFEAGVEYKIFVDSDIEFDVAYDSKTYPFDGQSLTYTNGWRDGAVDNSRLFCFSRISTNTADATSGNALVYLEYPDEVFRWDAATFQSTPDGETVEVYVEENDGSGYTEISGPISRGEGIEANASSDLRFRVELQRDNTDNNPTLDALYLRWVV